MDKKNNIQDFLNDPSFANWAKRSDAKDMAKWDSWLAANPDQQELVEDAKMMVGGFAFKKPQMPENQADRSWENFSSKINPQPLHEAPAIPIWKKLWKIAAVLLILVISLWGIQQFRPAPGWVAVESGLHETKPFELPDGSSVILNTNSKVVFPENWAAQDVRTLQLEGEAYFEITKQPEGKKLQVVANGLTVEVIGTSFNLNSKRPNPVVSLTEGKINLIAANTDGKILDAGQTAYFNKEKNTFEITPDEADYWKAWTLQKWSFGEATPMKEILERIKETYHLEYHVSDPAILQKTASGEVSIENREVLLEALSFLLEINMEVENNELHVSPQ